MIAYRPFRRGVILSIRRFHQLPRKSVCLLLIHIMVSIYENLSRAEETRLFIDINTKQVGVPAALLLDIKQLAQIEGERDTTLVSRGFVQCQCFLRRREPYFMLVL